MAESSRSVRRPISTACRGFWGRVPKRLTSSPSASGLSISGHKTISMFIRYNITSASDKIDALRKMAEHLAAQPKEKQDGALVDLPGREAVSR